MKKVCMCAVLAIGLMCSICGCGDARNKDFAEIERKNTERLISEIENSNQDSRYADLSESELAELKKMTSSMTMYLYMGDGDLNVREEPDADADIVDTLGKGAIVYGMDETADDDAWVKIEYAATSASEDVEEDTEENTEEDADTEESTTEDAEQEDNEKVQGWINVEDADVRKLQGTMLECLRDLSNVYLDVANEAIQERNDIVKKANEQNEDTAEKLTELSDQYDEFVKNYKKLSSAYDDLLEEHKALQKKYNEAVDAYNELVEQVKNAFE